MAISVDATVARWTGTPTSGGTAVSASFTPANGSLLVVCINCDESPGPNTATPSGGGWTYTSRVARGQSDATEGLAEIWTAPVTTGASMTITVTRAGTDSSGRRVSAKVYIVTGQHASPIGNVNEADWTTNPQTLSITAAGAGRLFGCGTDWNQTGVPVSTDTEDGADYAGAISVMSAFKAADHASGSQSIQFDPVGTPTGNVVVLEILAAASGGALTGSSSVTFSPTGTLTGAGALTGSAAVTFSPTSTLTGTAPISGSATVTFSSTGMLLGIGALSGASAVTFSPTGALTGAGALAGAATLTFAPTATLTGAGALSGTATVTFSPTGTLADSSSGLAGATAFTFTVVGTLTGTGALSGATTLTFSPSGVLSDASAPEIEAVQSSGGYAFYLAFEQHQERRRRRKRREEELRLEEIQAETDREIAKLLHEQEAIDDERADLARIQALADEYAGTRQPVPRNIAASLLKAQEERTRNALEQLQREMDRLLEEESVAIATTLLLDTD